MSLEHCDHDDEYNAIVVFKLPHKCPICELIEERGEAIAEQIRAEGERDDVLEELEEANLKIVALEGAE